MSVAGKHLHDPNFRLRILLIIFFGIVMFGTTLYWRTTHLASQEYVEFPVGTGISSANKPANPAISPPNRVRKDLKGYEDLYK